MKLIIDAEGEIINIIFKNDYEKINLNRLNLFDMDEVFEDSFIINNIIKTFKLRDINGKGKFYIKNDELFERKNWNSYKKENYLYER